MKMIATRNAPYGGKQKKGDEFEATPSQARILVALGSANYPPDSKRGRKVIPSGSFATRSEPPAVETPAPNASVPAISLRGMRAQRKPDPVVAPAEAEESAATPTTWPIAD